MQQIIVCPRSTNVHGYAYYLSAVLSCIWLKYFEQGLSSLDMSKKKSERAFATTAEKKLTIQHQEYVCFSDTP